MSGPCFCILHLGADGFLAYWGYVVRDPERRAAARGRRVRGNRVVWTVSGGTISSPVESLERLEVLAACERRGDACMLARV